MAARVVDTVLAGAGAMLLFGAGNAISYGSLDCLLPRIAGCPEATGDGFGDYAALVLGFLAFGFPLLYEVAFGRTSGKRIMGLDLVELNTIASRPARLKRAALLWTPLLVFNFLASLSVGEALAALLSWLPLLYLAYLSLSVLRGATPLHDRLAGTTVARVESAAFARPSPRLV